MSKFGITICSMCQGIGDRYKFIVKDFKRFENDFASVLNDRMTECRCTAMYISGKSFNERLVLREDLRRIDVIGKLIPKWSWLSMRAILHGSSCQQDKTESN